MTFRPKTASIALLLALACSARAQDIAVSDLSQTPRVMPAAMVAAGLMPRPLLVGGAGLGKITVSKNPVELAYLLFSGNSNTGVVFVDCANGNDSNSGTATAPLLTPAHAIRDLTAAHVAFYAGTCPAFDFRSTDTAGAVLKHLTTINGPVTFQVPGPALSGQTWTAVPGLSGVYQTTLSVSGAQAPQRVLSTISSDAWGYEQRLPLTTSCAALSGGSGWFYSAGVMCAAFNGLNINTYRGSFRALYTDAIGNARLLVYGARIIFDGQFVADGVNVLGLNWDANTMPYVFARGMNVQYAPDHNWLQVGGLRYTENVRAHASLYDNFSCRPATATSQGLCIAHNVVGTDAGDAETFGAGGKPNRNGWSAEPGANDAIFGALFEGSLGPNVANVGGDGYTNYSWLVGVVTRNSAMAPPTQGIEIQSTRTAWLDSCAVTDEDTTLHVDNGATVKTFNSQFSAPPVTDTGGTISAYTPNAP